MSKYSPSSNLLQAVRSLFPLETCPWDDYYMRMAQTDFLLGRHKKKASKTYFIRKAPFGGFYAILGGLTTFLSVIHDYSFDANVCEALKDQGYKKEFIDYLSKELFRIKVDVYSIPEGAIFLPNEPVIILEGELASIRIAEGVLLKNVNYPSLSMTKWNRVVMAASPGKTLEFSRRRAQDDLRTSLYAHLAGVNFSSNSDVRKGADIKIVGTHGHEYVLSFGDEYEAFDKWLECNPDRPVLLVDTIDTLKSGVPNAIRAFKKHMDRIISAGGTPGIRNDSGDLAYITLEEIQMLNAASLDNVLIFQTNDLDEYSIQTIKEQIFTNASRAGLDPFKVLSRLIWACGTNPGTCSDQSSIGGVAKLTSIENKRGEEKAVIKLAKDNPIKTSIPGSNRSAFIWDGDQLLCCLIYQKSEDISKCAIVYHQDDIHKNIVLQHYKNLIKEPRQILVYESTSNSILYSPSFTDVINQTKKDVDRLHWTHKRFQNPHTIKVSLTESLFQLRENLINNKKLIED